MPPSAAAGNRRGLTVAVVGATGLVGGELLRVLEARRFPAARLLPFSSGRARQTVSFRGRALPAPAPTFDALRQAGLVLMVSSDEVSRRWSPALARGGAWVIDDSSAFRLDPRVPLVIPEINADALSPRRRLVAGPNCTLTGVAVAGWPLAKAAGVRAVRLASYQAVSGAGKAALEELSLQMLSLVKARAWRAPPPSRSGGSRRLTAAQLGPLPGRARARALPRPIALNVFPQVGALDGRGDSGEESKVAGELRKIWRMPALPVSVTAVRVPVLRGHSLAVWLETRRPLSPERARSLLGRAPGVRLWPAGAYPTPRDAHATWPVHVGRVRRGTSPRELCLWVVTDNLLKGAALNSVQIAEELLRRRWLPGNRLRRVTV